jgi:hypothetical protein
VFTAQTEIVAANKRTCATIVAMVLTLLIVPALVRAAGPLAGNTTPLLRLNRGVDVPESKCRIAGAPDQIAITRAHRVREMRSVVRRPLLVPDAEPLAESPFRSPAVLRGPPASL